jgi:dienelactone hydrolase
VSSGVRRQQVPLASPVAGDPGREVRLTLWHGSGRPDGEGPLVVYSHGQGGRPAEARDLAVPLASRGWTVAAPGHRDERAGRTGTSGDVHARYAYRVADLRRTLDHLAPRFDPLAAGADPSAAGADASAAGAPGRAPRPVLLMGFSLGAYPALVLAGLPPGPADPRVLGLVLLSPAVFVFDDDAFDRLSVPSLSIYGEAEGLVVRSGVGRRERARRIAARLGERGELVEVAGAGHLALVRRRPLRDLLPPARRTRRRVARRVLEFVAREAGVEDRLMRGRL